MIDYNKILSSESNTDVCTSDLCNAIVDASMMQDVAEIAEATKLLMGDLGVAILKSDSLWYLVSTYTQKPYINETMATPIFDDEYYAQKFVDGHSNLKLKMLNVKQKDFERFFVEIYNTGIWAVSYLSDNKCVNIPIEKYLLSDIYDSNTCRAQEFDKYSIMLMQEIRNPYRQYDQKNKIVDLLKKNIIDQVSKAHVFVPINAINEKPSTQLVVSVKYGQNLKLVTMRTEDQRVFFPVYTSVNEFEKNSIDGVNLVSMPLSEFVRVIRASINKDSSIVGIVSNPGSVGFAMSKQILDIFLSYQKNT